MLGDGSNETIRPVYPSVADELTEAPFITANIDNAVDITSVKYRLQGPV
jgi:hypothetical protein